MAMKCCFYVLMLVMTTTATETTLNQSQTTKACRSVVYNVQTLHQTNTCCHNETASTHGEAAGDLKSQLAALQSKLQALEEQIKSLGVNPTPVPNAENQHYNYMDEMAQASCVAMMPGGGWAYAVRKTCGGTKTCATICAQASLKAQDGQVAKRSMSCFNSLHVYTGRPRLNLKYGTDTEKLGLKVYRYNACGGGCGPNYCCCRAI